MSDVTLALIGLVVGPTAPLDFGVALVVGLGLLTLAAVIYRGARRP